MVGVVGIFSVMFAPYWGRRNDNSGYSKTLLTVAAAVTVSTAVQAIAPNYVILFIVRAITGIFFCRFDSHALCRLQQIAARRQSQRADEFCFKRNFAR